MLPPRTETLSTHSADFAEFGEPADIARSQLIANRLAFVALADRQSEPTPIDWQKRAIDVQHAALDQLPPEYQWLSTSDPAALAELMREVAQFRRDYQAEHNAQPSAGRIYRHFRLQVEVAGDDDSAAHERVTLLDALMQGDVSGGRLPF